MSVTSHRPTPSGPWRRSLPSPKWSRLCHQSLVSLGSSAIQASKDWHPWGSGPLRSSVTSGGEAPGTNKQESTGLAETTSLFFREGRRPHGSSGAQNTAWAQGSQLSMRPGAGHFPSERQCQLRMDASWRGWGYDRRVLPFSGVGMEAQGGPHRHRARKERRGSQSHSRSSWTLQMSLLRVKHSMSQRHADRVTAPWPRLASDTQEGTALEKN